MPTTYKVLGQSAPSATTDTDLYTVPSATSAVVSTIVIANLDASIAFFRIAVRPSGETLENKHYIAYNVGVGLSDSTTLTLGLTLSAGDVITVRSSNANLVFNVFGSEIDL